MKLNEMTCLGLALLCLAASSFAADYPSKASKDERRALDKLASEIEGAIIYTRGGKVRKVTIGDWREVDLGEGDYVRWGPLGRRIAGMNDGKVFVMNADGSNRKQVIDGVSGGDGCMIEFHTNGREILYGTKRKGLWSVDIASGKKRDMKIPFNTELNISADGRHLVGRRGDCFLVELPGRKVRKYAGGCSPCVSPDGKRMTSNKGGHRTMDIQKWNGKRVIEINAKKMQPDGKWDNMHWSNHNDFIAMQGDNRKDEAYAFRISKNQGTRLSWAGRTEYPDLFIAKDLKTGESPMEVTLAWAETKLVQKKSDEKPKAKVVRNQRPDEVRALTPEVVEPEKFSKEGDWPGDQRDLVFLWENGSATNQLRGAGNQAGRLCEVIARGRAVFGRFNEMGLAGGAMLAKDVDSTLLDACKHGHALTIEATITPANITQDGPARIVSFSNGSSARNFTLGQDEESLILRLRTPKGDSQQLDLCDIEAGRTVHVVTTYRPGEVTCYVDGKQVLKSDRVSGDFSNWEPMHLLFGDEWNGDRDWKGAMEGVAIYGRAVSEAEAKHKYNLYSKRLGDRQPLERLVVEATLLEKTPTPTVEALKEYGRGIVIHSYEVGKVIAGQEDAKKIQIAHWALLDRELVPETDQKKVGQVYTLHLEDYTKHPQLQAERTFNDCEDFDIPVYYDIAARGVGVPPEVIAQAKPIIHLKVNCAGPTIEDWQSDKDFLDDQNQGNAFKFKKKANVSSVSDPAPVKVYNTVRHREHGYAFDVPNGDYLVRLHFTDDYDDDGNKRKMDFVIENERALEGFNIVKAAGSTGKAVVREFSIKVSDGNGLQIRGEDPNGGDVFAAGIEIVSR